MYEYRPNLNKLKENGEIEKIDMTGFLKKENEVISGLLYSKVGINWLRNWLPQNLAEDFIFIHNPNAKNKLPIGWLKAGHEYWFEGDFLIKFNHKKQIKEERFQILRQNGRWNLVDIKRQLQN